ncbi:hypothetical protein [Polluticaenibacter yanchengensis]|uniref:PNPLA domain-containing protein n=1 Tax=Polluticaenibacter yanchengensis TaxID=3014562 RepID=A0ABT4UKH8_9BACT|nr:hypothetical protein [Chitinophagaceae bacterium LY-5]
MLRKVRTFLFGVYTSLPVQLFLLHFKKFQVLLIFWFILIATINGHFMFEYGANMLFLYPEYLGSVNWVSMAILGSAFGMFISCWNITTFILHAKRLKFLAATAQPFLKFSINNLLIPILFLVIYYIKTYSFLYHQQLLPTGQVLFLMLSSLLSCLVTLLFIYLYFFGADRTIYKTMPINDQEILNKYKDDYAAQPYNDYTYMNVHYYLSGTLKLKVPRNVNHYSTGFLDSIFKQHHRAAILFISIIIALLIASSFFIETSLLQVPAGASITAFFALLIVIAGALSYIFGTWSLIVVFFAIFGLNSFYKFSFRPSQNKAYGLVYDDSLRTVYSRKAINDLAADEKITADSLHFINILNNWKRRQTSDKPTITFVSVSGGGSRSALFTAEIMYALDSITNHHFYQSTIAITGASGGMLGAAWYRALNLKVQEKQIAQKLVGPYLELISKDLLNPIFSSMVTRDLVTPPQYFTYQDQRYTKDRGYAFEQNFDANTLGFLNHSIDYYKGMEQNAETPVMILSNVNTIDARKFNICAQPISFLMRPNTPSYIDKYNDADAIDFKAFFRNNNGGNLSMLSALRMNATFPYVLPNVHLPTSPIIDVMDAGFRDNTGLENAIRFLSFFNDWLTQNCEEILLVQIMDRPQGSWNRFVEKSPTITDPILKPATLTQKNMFHFQEYSQMLLLEEYARHNPKFKRVLLEYIPFNKKNAASLSFHLTEKEKRDIKATISSPPVIENYQQIVNSLNAGSISTIKVKP